MGVVILSSDQHRSFGRRASILDDSMSSRNKLRGRLEHCSTHSAWNEQFVGRQQVALLGIQQKSKTASLPTCHSLPRSSAPRPVRRACSRYAKMQCSLRPSVLSFLWNDPPFSVTWPRTSFPLAVMPERLVLYSRRRAECRKRVNLSPCCGGRLGLPPRRS